MIENFDIFIDKKQNCYQLRTKTISYTLQFDDKEKEDIFLNIVSEIKKNKELNLKELQQKVQTKSNVPKVIDVLKTLDEYRFLSYKISKELNNKIKDTGYHYSMDVKQSSDFILCIFGQGGLTKKIKEKAIAENFKEVKTYLFNDEIDFEKAVNKSDFIIVDANEWSPLNIEIINKTALKHNKPWLYVGGLEEESIKIGPLFYGKETGCYNCLISRIKSNHAHPTFLNSYEDYLRSNRKSSKPDITPNSTIIYNIIANLTLLEVMKFIELWSLPVTWRSVININITNLNSTKHNLLKKPFCEVCKPELLYNPSPWLEAITLK